MSPKTINRHEAEKIHIISQSPTAIFRFKIVFIISTICCQLTSKIIPSSILSLRAHLWLDLSYQHSPECFGNPLAGAEGKLGMSVLLCLMDGEECICLDQTFFRDIFLRETPENTSHYELWAQFVENMPMAFKPDSDLKFAWVSF